MEDFIYRLAVSAPGFVMAIVFHEYAHALMALKFGDRTAQMAGRLTLNPTPHMDLLGTVILPAVGAMLGGVMFGWAKPVPINERNFTNFRKGIFWVSFAGPLMNIIIGTLSAFFYALMNLHVNHEFFFHRPFVQMLEASILINFVLAVFNLLPLPPLDGSKMVTSLLSYEAVRKYEELSRYSFLIFIVLMISGLLRYLLIPAAFLYEFSIRFFYGLLA